ncbi:MAG TPA: hypothetical protein ENI85_17805 [Deltaproteobacteria bacterium]|nr:hypothetical protein [Deltaproteobacteria bacterium]
MSFSVPKSTLESLEWERVVGKLRACCRSPLGRGLLADASGAMLFESDDEGVRARMRETSEARALLERDILLPLGGCIDLEPLLARAEKGFLLEGAELVELGTTLSAMHASRRLLDRNADEAPALASLARKIEPQIGLAEVVERCMDPSGDVRDAASATLARAREEVRRRSSMLKRRIERAIGHEDIAPHLSDRFYTVRNERFVLPVRAAARGRVRGIVHDASRSGTTIYVEPEDMIEPNNLLRQAGLTVEREIQRVLRELSSAVADTAGPIRESLAWLARLDLAFARGIHSRETGAVEPEIGREGIFELPALRHPLLPADGCVANDLRVGGDFAVLLLSGPNAGGKTVALKSVALAALMVRAGMHVLAGPGARVDLADRVLAEIGDHQDIRESLSTFSAAMTALAGILRDAGPHVLVCLDEIGVGTDPSEGAAIAQATLEALADAGARVVTTTHYNLLKEMAEIDPRFENASVEFDPRTLAPTYHVRIGSPGASSASAVAARMGLPRTVLARAAALLDREDRRLDRMLSELAATRAGLEAERRAAEALRAESDALREQYRAKLARLRERRDELFVGMRRDLEAAFREAHSEVARIVADLQRTPSSRRAARAREELEVVREEAGRHQAESGLVPEPTVVERAVDPIDWSRIRAGDRVRAPGGGVGTLLSLPDKKGRVRVQIAGAKLMVPHDQLAATTENNRERSRPASLGTEGPSPAHPDRSAGSGGAGGLAEVDLRGLRVDEALDRLDRALDLATAEGRDAIRIIHGIGTGALRSAVREHLPRSPHVVDWMECPREEGGAGATRGILRKD